MTSGFGSDVEGVALVDEVSVALFTGDSMTREARA